MKLPRKLLSGISKHTFVLCILGCLWMAGGVVGLRMLWLYATAGGRSGDTPLHWPVSSPISRKQDTATIVVFAHPKCPCTRATIEGLAWIMARVRKNVEARVLFFLPDGYSETWVRTDLWNSAQSIPGVVVSVDQSGVEAHRFGAQTSGYTVVYDSRGQLTFKGGLTASRGHSGDSTGRNAIPSLLIHPMERTLETPVFGCPLFSEKSDCAGEVSICQQQQ
jgi:hypothetical protein